jgi:hypothetical protein
LACALEVENLLGKPGVNNHHNSVVVYLPVVTYCKAGSGRVVLAKNTELDATFPGKGQEQEGIDSAQSVMDRKLHVFLQRRLTSRER